MAKISAGLATSHVPAIGAALDNGKKEEAYWKPVFAGYEFSKRWISDRRYHWERRLDRLGDLLAEEDRSTKSSTSGKTNKRKKP